MQNAYPDVVKAQIAVVAEFLSSNGIETTQPAILTLLAQLQTAESSVVAAANADAANWSVSAGAMTEAQYVKRSGLCCPSCGSNDISANDLDTEGTSAWQQVSCNDCFAEWRDDFTLTGYSDLEGGINLGNIESVVEDVKDRAKKYEFHVDDEEQARDCIEGSANALNITLSEAETKLAVDRLTS